MKKIQLRSMLTALLLVMSLLAACGSPAAPAGDAGADAGGDAAVESSGGEESAAGEYDLGGREVTIAIENAYLPFSYISLETGEPAGWDYDAM
ncbi:MAG: hypothetical protein AAF639_43185 [Chloroflexota bacterium]